VVIVEMHVLFEDRPAGDVVFKGLDTQANLDKLKKSSVVFKESCHYKLKFVFRVQHDIVTGLRYHNGVYKAGIRGMNGSPIPFCCVLPPISSLTPSSFVELVCIAMDNHSPSLTTLKTVAKEDLMLGSYPPQEQVQEVVWPRHGWEEAPSGMLARGSYKSTIKFIDDDDVTHLQFDYGFSIKKDWGKDKEYARLTTSPYYHSQCLVQALSNPNVAVIRSSAEE
jgi:Rho GDP-dissociation inhibitor